MSPLRSWLFLVLHVVPFSTVIGASVGGISTCDDQYNCLKATLTPGTGGPSCGACTYKLCLEIDYRDGCAKSSTESTSGISHVCQKSETVCAGNYTGFADASTTRVNSGIYDNGSGDVFSMCQYGTGGQMLNFLMKDASSDCSPLSNQVNILGLENTGASTSCTSLTSVMPAIQGCGGETNVWATECVWTIQLPECGAPLDCVWNAWTEWGTCTKSCGSGTRTRSRTKQSEASNGGSCPGDATEADTCNPEPCGATVTSVCPYCEDFLNGGCRECCPDTGSCQDSSCTVLGFPNSAKANCQTGSNSNCPGSLCSFKNASCPELLRYSDSSLHCYGTVACSDDGETCYGFGELCLQDGNSDNFKICADACEDDTQCPTDSKCDTTQDPAQCVPEVAVSSTDCVWGTWQAWDGCSVTCGDGTRTRSREVTTAAANGGLCPGSATESGACNSGACGGGQITEILETCATQADCIAFEVRHVDSPRDEDTLLDGSLIRYSTCGQCQLEVCLKRLNRFIDGQDVCSKGSDAISQVCLKDQCPSDRNPVKQAGFDMHAMQCERLLQSSPGAPLTAKFIVQDGNSAACTTTTFPSPTLPPVVTGEYATAPGADDILFACGPSSAGLAGSIDPGFVCGQARTGECVWQVTVPAELISHICPTDGTVQDTPPASCVLECNDRGFQNVVSTVAPKCDWEEILRITAPYDCEACEDRKLVCRKGLSLLDEAKIEACI